VQDQTVFELDLDVADALILDGTPGNISATRAAENLHQTAPVGGAGLTRNTLK